MGLVSSSCKRYLHGCCITCDVLDDLCSQTVALAGTHVANVKSNLGKGRLADSIDSKFSSDAQFLIGLYSLFEGNQIQSGDVMRYLTC
jgi:hypothetical protein